jgi:hypothetical protein
MSTLVWAFQPLKELDNQTGFVECEDNLAALLIESGKAQDPRDGALVLKHIVAPPPLAHPEAPAATEQTYDDKAMTPKRPPRGK